MDMWLKSVLRAVLVAGLATLRSGVNKLPWFVARMITPLLDEAEKNIDAIIDAILLRILQELGSLPPAEFGALPPDLQTAARGHGFVSPGSNP